MKPTYLFLLLIVLGNFTTQAQQILQEVIVDYQILRNSSKTVKITLPKNTKHVFYRVTTFQNDKVNTADAFYNSIRVVNPDKIIADNYDFAPHFLASNTDAQVKVQFYTDKAKTASCTEIEAAASTAGILKCRGEEIYAVISPVGKRVTAKLEIVALADRPEDPVNDRFPFTIQNEMTGEIAYEISGDRTNWQAFFLPSMRKAEFKLADNQVYLRVSTLEKVTEEYKIDSGKKYRFFWNKDKNRLDLGEIPASK